MRGLEAPSEHPEAEMWFGAHPGSPSALVSAGEAGGVDTLEDLIDADPEAQVGQADGRLPFLLKLLAAAQPLSIQVHPTKLQAEEGFARENAAGIPVEAFERNYRDDNHKPELLVALTPFEALAGLRPVAQTQALCAALDVPELRPYLGLLGSGDDSGDLRSLLTTLITLPSSVLGPLLDALTRRCAAVRAGASLGEQWMDDVAAMICELADQHPGDSGLLCALLLNYVVLEPGEAMFLDAGQLHAYVKGVGVEVMANSDNVLRGGLTTKHMDVPELMRIVRCAPLEDPTFEPDEQGVYRTAADEFQLQKLSSETVTESQVAGPAIILGVSGDTEVAQDGEKATLHATEAVWVAAAEASATVRTGGVAFIARVG